MGFHRLFKGLYLRQYLRHKPLLVRELSANRRLYHAKPSAKPSIASCLLLVIPGATFCLGCWQVYRRQWKLQLIDRLEQLVRQPAIDLPQHLAEVNGLEYQKVRLRGRFDHTMEMFISPRSLLKPEEDRS
ncbi:unnamed protein product, partial [Medioppia subpectinata]